MTFLPQEWALRDSNFWTETSLFTGRNWTALCPWLHPWLQFGRFRWNWPGRYFHKTMKQPDELDDSLAAIIAAGLTAAELDRTLAKMKAEADRLIQEMPTAAEMDAMVSKSLAESEQALRELLGPSDNES